MNYSTVPPNWNLDHMVFAVCVGNLFVGSLCVLVVCVSVLTVCVGVLLVMVVCVSSVCW